ncbi:glucosaminidase domain-containing protein [Membranihabitans maritimus]|uniref:glucosaminidase domain-containing protein n=1 Tax=Membranihabitans maritimus TaxID=2904244 RepID=UPI001F37A32C|nr:glucosaminidase domain-containing protein [Membranihabitans maritimus]
MIKQCTFLFLLVSVQSFAYNNADVLNYIERYKEIAVSEMHVNGIPASIKMAQAILESNSGKSDLATQANNHFGIKCGGAWNGDTYYKKDDDRDRRGRLVPSCFRVFESGEDSFIQHSMFLKDPKKEYRYGELFKIDKTDYKSWAWGLKKSGYATNPAYANLLINLIEKYSLYTFDYYEKSNIKYLKKEDLIVKAKDIKAHDKLNKTGSEPRLEAQRKSPSGKALKSDQVLVNDRMAAIVLEGQTVESISRQFDISEKKVEKYNDLESKIKKGLKPGSFIFLEKKRRSYRGAKDYHVVKEGETLHQISQQYGIRLSTLVRKNKIDEDMVPIAGEKIKLKGRSVRSSEIPLTYDDVVIMESDKVTEPTIVSQSEMESPTLVEKEPTSRHAQDQKTEANKKRESSIDFSKELVSTVEQKEDQRGSKQENYINYEIQKGDTLYKISRQFNSSVDEIKLLNKLTTDSIRIGQILKIKS